ncbi:MAG: FAD synthetase family protein [Sneathiellaceae bacterium]
MFPDDRDGGVRIACEGDLDLPASVVTIGAFDGVHRGHQALISAAIRSARALRLPAVVWTFDPLPKVLFAKARPLTPRGERLARIAALGPDWIIVSRFTPSYAARSAERFLASLAGIAPQQVHVGGDFRFGAGQSGDIALLRTAFPVVVHGPVRCGAGQVVSSSRIRSLRDAGDEPAAAALLDAPAGAFLAGLMMLTANPGCGDG